MTVEAPAAATTSAAESLVAQLESYGVEYVFGTCGHTNIALLDALGRSSISFVIARHEQAAAHAADGYARASGRPGVLLVHVGPGMMNAVTGVATAAMDSVPLVAISGDVLSYFYGRHPHQEVNLHADADQTAIYRPFVKRAWHVRRAEDLSRFTERAFWTATSGRPGAVLLNVPMDLFSRQVSPAVRPLPEHEAAPALPASVARRIAIWLAEAERPLDYLGGGLRDATGRDALLAFAEHLDVPIAHSLMAKGAVPDDHPLLLGMPGFWGLETTNDYAREADVVLALATRFAETDASSWDPAYTWNLGGRDPASGRLIQIDIDPAEIGRNHPVEIGAVADVTSAVQAIAEAVREVRPEPKSRPGLRERIRSARSGLFAGSRERGRGDDFPLRPERILAELRDALPPDAVLVTDVGWNKNGVAQCYELPASGRFITPGGASTMGFGPAAAVGVQIAQPDRVVVALVGDGGMSAQLPAVPMAVEQGLPVIFVVMNNRAHGTIADLQAANFGASHGCEFRGPDDEHPTVGTNIARKIDSQNYIAMLGTAESAVTIAMAPTLRTAEIPNIASGQSPGMVDLKSPFLFLNAHEHYVRRDPRQVRRRHEELTKIAMITNNGAYGKGEHDAFLKALTNRGIKPVADQVVTIDQKDFSAQLTKIRQKSPEVIFLGAEEVESGLIVKQARDLGIDAPFAGAAPQGTPVYLDTAGAANAEGTIVSSPYLSNDLNEATKKFAAAYKAAYGEEAEMHGAKAYDGAQILLTALRNSNVATGRKLADAIRAVKHKGLLGDFDYDETGVGIKATKIGVITEGKLVQADDS